VRSENTNQKLRESAEALHIFSLSREANL
jgi:hypothetical protein